MVPEVAASSLLASLCIEQIDNRSTMLQNLYELGHCYPPPHPTQATNVLHIILRLILLGMSGEATPDKEELNRKKNSGYFADTTCQSLRTDTPHTPNFLFKALN